MFTGYTYSILPLASRIQSSNLSLHLHTFPYIFLHFLTFPTFSLQHQTFPYISLHFLTLHFPTSIYKFGLSVCLFVCLYPINVKTAEPIRPKFFVGHHVILGKVYGWSSFQKFASIKIRFLKCLKIHDIFFIKSAKFLFLLPRRTPMLFIKKRTRM